MKVINYDSKVFYTGKGRHFHVFDDCRGLWQGRTNSMKYGRELHGEGDLTYQEAVHLNLYGCEFCHRRLGVSVPDECSLKVARARNAAARAAKRAAKAEAAVSVEIPVIEATNTTPQVDVEALISEIQKMLAQLELAIA
jgi:hypothetical protein